MKGLIIARIPSSVKWQPLSLPSDFIQRQEIRQMPMDPTDFVNPQNLNTKSGLVIDIRDDEFGATPDKECSEKDSGRD